MIGYSLDLFLSCFFLFQKRVVLRVSTCRRRSSCKAFGGINGPSESEETRRAANAGSLPTAQTKTTQQNRYKIRRYKVPFRIPYSACGFLSLPVLLPPYPNSLYPCHPAPILLIPVLPCSPAPHPTSLFQLRIFRKNSFFGQHSALVGVPTICSSAPHPTKTTSLQPLRAGILPASSRV